MTTTPTILYCGEAPMRDSTHTWFRHFCVDPRTVLLYGEKEVLKVRVAETEKPEGADPKVYWAFWDYDEKGFRHVYPIPGLVSMIFPYGVQAEIDRGRGLLLPVTITVLKRGVQEGVSPL